MNKKIFTLVSLVIVLFAVASVAVADPLKFGPVTNEGYTATICVNAVTFFDNPNVSGVVENTKREWVIEYVKYPATFQGAKLYALGIKEDWRGGKAASKVLFENALTSVPVTALTVSLHFKNRHPGKIYYQPIIWVVELANGVRGWIVPGFPDGPYVVWSRLNEAQTWVTVDSVKGKVLGPDDEARRRAKQLD